MLYFPSRLRLALPDCLRELMLRAMWPGARPMALVLVLGGWFPVSGAIVIDSFSSAVNDRFQDADDLDQFLMAAYDLSGVGMDSNGRWASVIGPNTIIAANHFKPSGLISFYTGNDPASGLVQVGLSSDSVRIGDSDLWLARLEQHVPSSIGILTYATEQVSEPTAPGGPNSNFTYKDALANMTGRSPSSFSTTLDQAYGENEISAFDASFDASNLGLGSSLDVFRLDYNTGATTYESAARSGDSGAPLLYDDGGGQLLLLGINSFVSNDSEGNPAATFVSYVGNDSAEIDQIVADWALIPEPATTGLMVLACTFVFGRRRRTGKTSVAPA